MLPVQDVNARISLAEFVRQLACSVGRIVIDDKHVNGDGQRHKPLRDLRQILPFVVRRNDDQRFRTHLSRRISTQMPAKAKVIREP
jgi:hypothetical protein